MEDFTRNLDELLYLTSQKHNLVYFMKKNYTENVHYKKLHTQPITCQRGGHNKQTYMLTEKAFELVKNSFNLRNKYIVHVSDNIQQINTISMCIENQTIGFIENAYKSVLHTKRQYQLGKYRIDLYFIDHKLAIECDENNHADRDSTNEAIRDAYIKSLGNTIIRFNPNETHFDLSNVLNTINRHLFSIKLKTC